MRRELRWTSHALQQILQQRSQHILLQSLQQRLVHVWQQPVTWLALLLLVHFGIDGRWNQSLALRSPPWSLVVVFAGSLILNGKQESWLALLFIALETQHDISTRSEHTGLTEASMFTRRALILVCCIWSASLRAKLEQQRHELTTSRAQISDKLVQSLQASALAHELRQPLLHLMLQTQLLLHRLERQTEAQPGLRKPLEQMQESGEQINGLIAAMTRLLRSESVPSISVNLAVVVHQSLQSFQSTLSAAGVEVSATGLDQPAWVKGDPEQLQIVCGNLLRNALQALQDLPRQQRRLRVLLERQLQSVALHVADSGPGLPDLRPRQLVMGSNNPEGMGLGLFTIQTILTRHGGELILGQSADLGGACISIRLPAASHANAGSDTAPPVAPVERR